MQKVASSVSFFAAFLARLFTTFPYGRLGTHVENRFFETTGPIVTKRRFHLTIVVFVATLVSAFTTTQTLGATVVRTAIVRARRSFRCGNS